MLQVKRRVLAALVQHQQQQAASAAGTGTGTTALEGTIESLPSDPSALQLLLPRPDPPRSGTTAAAEDGNNDNNNDEDGDDEDFQIPEYLGDADKLSVLNVKEDAILHVVLPVADNEWEAVDIVPTAVLE